MSTANALVMQCGGPTAVSNASLAGVIAGARDSDRISAISGVRWGLQGLKKGDWVDLGSVAEAALAALPATPGALLGSSRYRLQADDFPRILKLFKQQQIRYLFTIGGNGSMEALLALDMYFRQQHFDLKTVGIPKTVDNDLPGTDHCPGFPSAARSNILNIQQGGILARSMQKVDRYVIYQTIGRDAGWLAAATALAKRRSDEAPHLIYCPERLFQNEQFIADATAAIREYGWVSIVVSEGLRDPAGQLISAPDVSTASGRTEYGAMGGVSVGMEISRLLKAETGFQGEFQITESLIMCAADRVAALDRREAFQCGLEAVGMVSKDETGFMVSLERCSDSPYRIDYRRTPLASVAGNIRTLPAGFINTRGNYVTQGLYRYLQPLIGELPATVRLSDLKPEEALSNTHTGNGVLYSPSQ